MPGIPEERDPIPNQQNWYRKIIQRIDARDWLYWDGESAGGCRCPHPVGQRGEEAFEWVAVGHPGNRHDEDDEQARHHGDEDEQIADDFGYGRQHFHWQVAP